MDVEDETTAIKVGIDNKEEDLYADIMKENDFEDIYSESNCCNPANKFLNNYFNNLQKQNIFGEYDTNCIFTIENFKKQHLTFQSKDEIVRALSSINKEYFRHCKVINYYRIQSGNEWNIFISFSNKYFTTEIQMKECENNTLIVSQKIKITAAHTYFMVEQLQPSYCDILSDAFMLFANNLLQIRISTKVPLPGDNMNIILKYRNKTTSNILIKNILIKNRINLKNITIQFEPNNSFEIQSKQEEEQRISIKLCRSALNTLPEIKIKFMYNNLSGCCEVNCNLPVIANKFFQPINVNSDQFKTKWSDLKCEKQQMININDTYDIKKILQLLQRMHFAILDIDNNGYNHIGVCALYNFGKGSNNGWIKAPVMSWLKYDQSNKSDKSIRLCVKSSHESIVNSVSFALCYAFKQ